MTNGGQALDDPERLAAIVASDIAGAMTVGALERISRLVVRLLGTPTGLVNVVGATEQTTVTGTSTTHRFGTSGSAGFERSFCHNVVTSGAPFAVSDARTDARVSSSLGVTEDGVVAYLGVPLRDPEGHLLGSLCAVDEQPRDWTEEDRQALEDLSGMVSDELALRAAKREVEALARRDVLTGMPNRRAWDEQAPIELARAQRDGTPLCVALFDLDAFKAINDAMGHAAGDSVLVEIGERWPPLVRTPDLLARIGGDEFGLLMTNAPLPPAVAAAARLAAAHPTGVTVSWGAAQWHPGEPLPELVARADAELYGSKARRRER